MNSKDQNNRSRCVLVLGMHRSGTSALTRCLNLLGVDLGSHLLSPEKANAKGFWEHADAVRINDDLLQSFGMYWHSLDPLPANWLESEGAARAREEICSLIRRDFEGVPLWGLKDPRMCRLAPLWIQVLRDMNIDVAAIFVVRSPLEVAASLERAHGLAISSSVLSWLQHLAESEVATRDVMRTMVDYDHLLAEPFERLSHISRALDLTWPISLDDRKGAITSFLDVGLRTHRKQPSQDEVPPLVHRALEACHCIVVKGDSSEWLKLSRVADQYLDLAYVLKYLNKQKEEMAAANTPGSHTTTNFLAALYYAAEHEPFREEQVIRKHISAGRSHLELDLPDVNPAITRFRFDPMEGHGCCVLHSLVVLDGSRKVVGDNRGGQATLLMNGLVEIDSFTRPGQKLLLAVADPQMGFMLDVPSLPSLKGCTLNMDIDYLGPAELCDELQAALAWGRRQEGLLFEETGRAAAEAMRQQELLTKELERREAQHAEEIQKLSAARAQELGLMQQAHTSELSTLQMRMDGVIVHHQRELAARTEELQQIYNSTLWRMCVPVRRLLQRLPKDVRRNLRRLTKTVWWGLTPWHTPRRLQALKHAKRFESQLVAYPAQHLRCISSSQEHPKVWEVSGADPFFYLHREGEGAANKQGGWYMLDMKIIERSGTLNGPKLYLDHGRNFSEVWAFGLNHLRTQDGLEGLVRFEHDVSRMRFDPSEGTCEFSLGEISLRRISKFRAAIFLYRNLAARDGHAFQLARDVFSKIRRDGLRQTGDWLYGRFARQSKTEVGDYESWLKLHDTVAAEDLQAAREDSLSMGLQPLISVVMPVFNTPESLLRSCIDSVLEQAYPYWELCIADDASSKPHVRKVLEQYCARDERIKVVYRTSNGHISEASNSALALASGEWIALLDHDDELARHALYVVAKAINERPDAMLFYSDEDKIDEDGQRYDPYFKSDWNMDLFCSQNMISHLGVYKTSLVRDIGGFRKGFEGSQDYDLALRCVEKISAEQIVHIPRVLYHWRAVPGSTALGSNEKSYAVVAAKKALEDHFSRVGEDCVKVRILDHGYRVQRVLQRDQQPKVSLIIPTRDRVELLRVCVESILRETAYRNYEIIVVDNQSMKSETHAYFEELRTSARVKVLPYDAPFNYSKINNMAAASSDGEIIGLINNDIEVIGSDWLCEMVSHAIRKEVGVVGAMLYYPNDTIQHAGVILGLGGVAAHVYGGKPRGFVGQKGRANLIQNLSAVTAACLLVRRETFDAVGGLDPSLEVAFNDVDFCLRIQALGLNNVWTPYAELYHHESASRGSEDTPEKQQRFMREVALMTERWGAVLPRDPAYNPNLTLEDDDFSLSSVPRLSSLKAVIAGKTVL